MAKPHLFLIRIAAISKQDSGHLPSDFGGEISVFTVSWLIRVYWWVWIVSGSLRWSFKWGKFSAKSDNTPTRWESLSRNKSVIKVLLLSRFSRI